MTTDFGGDGVVGGSAEVFDFDVERAEVGDESVFEVAAEGVGSGYDFEGTSCGVGGGCGGGLGHGCGKVKGESEK